MNLLKMAPARKFTFGAIQMLVGMDKAENLQKAGTLIARAAIDGQAQVISLPECFNSPYGTQHFAKYAERVPDGDTVRFLSATAKQHNVYLIGGTIPEIEGDKLYNTCTVFGPDGSLLAKYRKIHLFDIDIPGKMTFKESDVLSPGSDLATIDTPMCKIGIGICYDIRFAELGLIYSKKGCDMLVYPGAFNLTTGPAHWELLTRARAVDNQVYVAAVSQARNDKTDGYVAWGNSTVASPWGDVAKKLGNDEDVLLVDIDLDRMDEVRGQIPIRRQRRQDLYEVVIRAN